ncbi:four helix bundle protein [Bacillus sp. FJAT-45350]|uniref:four helix bundle protein n=1 Tax=Bacillus sp. FJAT-45350 TaxID=2011014 RepID=UPI000BB7D10D|nr:four helix bundle protein [Bacillus sp. FJAT-45350]
MYNDTSKLIVYQKAHTLVLEVYAITKLFPKEEQYGLTSQIRRAAVSIPSNIVEGKARGSAKEYRRFLLMARGSLEEVKYQLLLARDLEYIDTKTYTEVLNLAQEVGRILNGVLVAVEKG